MKLYKQELAFMGIVVVLNEVQSNNLKCFVIENQIRTNPSKIQALKITKLSMN